MDNLRFADNLDGESVVALGLPASRLGLAALGAVAAWAMAELPLPAAARLSAVCLIGIATVALAWGRVQGVSVARWAWLAASFVLRSFTAHGETPDQQIDMVSGTTAAARFSPAVADRPPRRTTRGIQSRPS